MHRIVTASLDNLARANLNVVHTRTEHGVVPKILHKDLKDGSSTSIARTIFQVHCDGATISNIERLLIRYNVDHTVDHFYPHKGHQVASIQVAATRFDGGDICVVEESDTTKTHYSVYTRGLDGLCNHVKDFDEKGEMEMARIEAMAFAADLSMQYQVPIEKII